MKHQKLSDINCFYREQYSPTINFLQKLFKQIIIFNYSNTENYKEFKIF